jgi:hypothetical protein
MARSSIALVFVVAAACTVPVAPEPSTTALRTTTTTTQTTTTAIQTSTVVETTSTTASPFARPGWLGTRLLPLRDDEHGQVQPTPPELVDRRLETLDSLPPPTTTEFGFTSGPVPAAVLARSTWSDECPVGVDQLAYLTMSHHGFDGELHTGEMIVNAATAEEVVGVFEALFAAGFPLEQMRVITAEEVEAHPTGDWNDTTSFVCRPAVGSESWSQHAYGLAIDINPFHNPYLKGDLVLPELASAYLDREALRPGMIVEGDVAVTAFRAIGWSWGGDWRSLKDWMHFSASGG